jgi:hypothetical protein
MIRISKELAISHYVRFEVLITVTLRNAVGKQSAFCLLGLPFDPEKGSNMLL